MFKHPSSPLSAVLLAVLTLSAATAGAPAFGQTPEQARPATARWPASTSWPR